MTEPILMRRCRARSMPTVWSSRPVVAPTSRFAGRFGVSFQRGPDQLKTLQTFLGKAGAALDLSRHALRILLRSSMRRN